MIAVALLLAAATGTATLDAMVKAATSCPAPAAGEIAVCGRRGEDERSRYLSPLPPEYEPGDPRARSVSAERNALFDYDVGRQRHLFGGRPDRRERVRLPTAQAVGAAESRGAGRPGAAVQQVARRERRRPIGPLPFPTP